MSEKSDLFCEKVIANKIINQMIAQGLFKGIFVHVCFSLMFDFEKT